MVFQREKESGLFQEKKGRWESILLGEKHSRDRPVSLSDYPEDHPLDGPVCGENPSAVDQSLVVGTPVFRRHLAPITSLMPCDTGKDVRIGDGFEDVGSRYDPAKP
jgi:hypothetical protein